MFFVLLLGLLLSPLAFQYFDDPIVKPLKGWQASTKPIKLTTQNWLDGSWQNNRENFAKEHLKLRHLLIRFNNQLKFSLFKKLNSRNVVMGKNNCFYEERYIKAYKGMDFLGEEKVAENVQKMQRLTDSLRSHGTQFLVVLVAGKGSFFPECFPPKYDGIPKGPNNYETYAKYLAQSTIPYLDINRYFLEMKDTSRYNLFTKAGVHWSIYGAYKAVDTLLTTIENLLQKDLPDYHYSPLQVTTKAKDTDNDIFEALNLLWTKVHETYAYKKMVLEKEKEGKYRPKVWVIADSFFWTLYSRKIPDNFFDPSALFMYYFNDIWQTDRQHYKRPSIKFTKKMLEQQDLIILFATETNIKLNGWKMVDTFLKVYDGK